jgi:hypothetical protein
MDTIVCSGPDCPICIQGVLVKLPVYIEEAAWNVFLRLAS